MKFLCAEVVRAIRDFDHSHSAGGIYSLPDLLSKGKRHVPHHHIFGGEHEEFDLCRKLGVDGKEGWGDSIGFEYEGYSASVRFLDVAHTKVRPYGNSYQLDRHHGKKWEDTSSDLKKSVCRRVKEERHGRSRDINLLVAIVFADSERHNTKIIEPSSEESFLERYRLTLDHDTWTDPHGRGIWTSVLCWADKQPQR